MNDSYGNVSAVCTIIVFVITIWMGFYIHWIVGLGTICSWALIIGHEARKLSDEKKKE